MYPHRASTGWESLHALCWTQADERKIRERGGGEASAPLARHSWLGKQPSADLESEFRDAADESTSLLHRPRSRFDTGQFSFRDAAQ